MFLGLTKENFGKHFYANTYRTFWQEAIIERALANFANIFLKISLMEEERVLNLCSIGESNHFLRQYLGDYCYTIILIRSGIVADVI